MITDLASHIICQHAVYINELKPVFPHNKFIYAVTIISVITKHGENNMQVAADQLAQLLKVNSTVVYDCKY
jgi:hypothetical protein